MLIELATTMILNKYRASQRLPSGKLTCWPSKSPSFLEVSLIFQPQQLPGSMLIYQRVYFATHLVQQDYFSIVLNNLGGCYTKAPFKHVISQHPLPGLQEISPTAGETVVELCDERCWGSKMMAFTGPSPRTDPENHQFQEETRCPMPLIKKSGKSMQELSAIFIGGYSNDAPTWNA